VDPRDDRYLDTPHVGGANIESKTGQLIELKTAREEGLISPKFAFDETAVLYSKIRPYLMKVARPDFRGLCSADIYPLSVKTGLISRDYLFHLLLSPEFTDYATAGSARAGMPKVNREHLFAFRVCLPPPPEQLRIVGILDEAFDGIATAKANAEKNLQNARDLFESHLQAVFTQRVKGWVEKRLEEVADANCTLSYGIVQPGDEYPDGLPVVRPTDLTTKVIQLSGLKRIDPELAGGYRRTSLYGRELLLCVRGSTGVVSIASAELVGANVTRGIVPIRFDADLLTPDFGFYLMSSGSVQSQIREKTYGAALMQINIRDLRNIMLSFPALKEQKVIAAKLDALSAKTQRLESIYQQKLAALGALKKSLLDQAFTGAL
jgi:type I restriction enzyme S subunit